MVKQGRPAEVEALFRRVLESCETMEEKESFAALVIVSSLAVVLLEQGRHTDAEPLHGHVLKGVKSLLRTKVGCLSYFSEDSWTSFSSLADVLYEQGFLGDAEALLRCTSELEDFSLCDQRPGLPSHNTLACVLLEQGRYDEAEPLFRRVLKNREIYYGPGVSGTLRSVKTLAEVLSKQGRYAEAEPLFRRALKGRESELGRRHPDTLASVRDLASVLMEQGRYAEAEPLFRRALHPNMPGSIRDLASVLAKQGRHIEAAQTRCIGCALQLCNTIVQLCVG